MFHDPAPDPTEDVPRSPVQALREDLDAVVGLLLQAQDATREPPSWAPLLAGMADRGTLTVAEVDRALDVWHVITEDEHAALTARLPAPDGAAAAASGRSAPPGS